MINEKLLGLKREEVIALIGNPDDKGGSSRKYKTPSIFKYNQIEVCFEPYKNGVCCLIFDSSSHKTLYKL